MDISGFRHWKPLERWMGWAAWIGLGIEAVLWLTLSTLSIESLPLLLLLGGVLVIGTLICASVLTVRYRHIFGTIPGFAGLIACLALVSWGRGITLPHSAATLALMAMVGLIAALPLSLLLLLRQRDVSLELLGLVLLAFVWGLLIASVPYGGPVRVWLQYVMTPDKGHYWWLETLTCLLMVILPLGSLAFLARLLRLVLKEIQGV